MEEKEIRVWDFVEKYYPDYDHCNIITEADDLQKILNGEINGYAEAIYNEIEQYLKNQQLEPNELKVKVMEEVQNRYNEIHVYVYEKAIEEFLKQ